MKKILLSVLLLVATLFLLTACFTVPEEKEDEITIEDGYLVVNGTKTEYQVKTEDEITVEDGYLVVNGVKTEYKVLPLCEHDWSVVTTPPTCTEGGYDTKTCTLCGETERTNLVSKVSHRVGDTYDSDEDMHWLSCLDCGTKTNKSAHALGTDGACTVCQRAFGDTEGVVYGVSSDSTYAEVLAYQGTATQVRIAATFNDLPVKSICKEAFASNKTVTSLYLPDTVATIGTKAFYFCTNLTTVHLGSSVTTIGDSAFYKCTSLSSVNIPDSLTRIADNAFYYCSSLTALTIGDGVESIGESAFEYCSRLASVTLGKKLLSIGESAFQSCTSLSSLTVSAHLVSVGADAFKSCNASLFTECDYVKYVKSTDNPYAIVIGTTSVNMDAYPIQEGALVIAGEAFASCTRLTHITIPSGVLGIGDSAFKSCTSLLSVDIPSTVTTVGSKAFYYCVGLTGVTLGKNVTSIGSLAFYHCESLSTLTLANCLQTVGTQAFYACDKLADIYYSGTAEEWSTISFGSNDLAITNANKHFNHIL